MNTSVSKNSHRIWVMGTTFDTKLLLEDEELVSKVHGLITLDPKSGSDGVAGFEDLRALAESLGLDTLLVDDYSLHSAKDLANIMSHKIDILLVFGWQRLVPQKLLSNVRICSVGVHGSVDGISSGRGRSPQNWAIIMGFSYFFFSLFLLDEGVDSGKVLIDASIEIEYDDYIFDTHKKVSQKSIEMIKEFLSRPQEFKDTARPQIGNFRYLPKRNPSDGCIDWNLKMEQIYNLVRGTSRPYPGAITWMERSEIKVWRIKEFQKINDGTLVPGSVLFVSDNQKEILVAARDGIMRVDEFEIIPNSRLIAGQFFRSCSQRTVLERIVKLHYSKYPNFKISEHLLTFIKSL